MKRTILPVVLMLTINACSSSKKTESNNPAASTTGTVNNSTTGNANVKPAQPSSAPHLKAEEVRAVR